MTEVSIVIVSMNRMDLLCAIESKAQLLDSYNSADEFTDGSFQSSRALHRGNIGRLEHQIFECEPIPVHVATPSLVRENTLVEGGVQK